MQVRVLPPLTSPLLPLLVLLQHALLRLLVLLQSLLVLLLLLLRLVRNSQTFAAWAWPAVGAVAAAVLAAA